MHEDWCKLPMYPELNLNMMPNSLTLLQHDFILRPEYFRLWNQLYGRRIKLKFTYTITGGDVVPKLSKGPNHGIDLFHQDLIHCIHSVKTGVASPLDISKIPNYKYLFDYFKRPITPLWNNRKCYGIPLTICKNTITYDTNQVDVPPEEATLDVIFDEDYNKKYGKNIVMPNDYESVLAAALYLDMPNPFDMTDEELKKCAKILKNQRKHVRAYGESVYELEKLFLTKEVNRAWTKEPVVKMVNDEDPKFNLVFPDTKSPTGGKGALGGFEGWGMSVDVDEKHEYASYLFINHCLGDDYLYHVFKALNYRPVSKAVVERMTPEEVKDRGLDDPEALLNSMQIWAMLPRQHKYTKLINEVIEG